MWKTGNINTESSNTAEDRKRDNKMRETEELTRNQFPVKMHKNKTDISWLLRDRG